MGLGVRGVGVSSGVGVSGAVGVGETCGVDVIGGVFVGKRVTVDDGVTVPVTVGGKSVGVLIATIWASAVARISAVTAF